MTTGVGSQLSYCRKKTNTIAKASIDSFTDLQFLLPRKFENSDENNIRSFAIKKPKAFQGAKKKKAALSFNLLINKEVDECTPAEETGGLKFDSIMQRYNSKHKKFMSKLNVVTESKTPSPNRHGRPSLRGESLVSIDESDIDSEISETKKKHLLFSKPAKNEKVLEHSSGASSSSSEEEDWRVLLRSTKRKETVWSKPITDKLFEEFDVNDEALRKKQAQEEDSLLGFEF